MNRYRDDPAALRALVRDDAVHRDVYTDPEIFQLEMERLWARTWIYVGHTSQVPNPGDYITCDIATDAGADDPPARRQRARAAQSLRAQGREDRRRLVRQRRALPALPVSQLELSHRRLDRRHSAAPGL